MIGLVSYPGKIHFRKLSIPMFRVPQSPIPSTLVTRCVESMKTLVEKFSRG